jgi:COP9 signalosome complex subunit 6
MIQRRALQTLPTSRPNLTKVCINALSKVCLVKQVLPLLEIVGWYATGSAPTLDDVFVHKQFIPFNENPVHVRYDPYATSSQLPVTVYDTVMNITDGEAQLEFAKLDYHIVTEDAERLAVEQVVRTGQAANVGEDKGTKAGQNEGNESSAPLMHVRGAVRMLKENVHVLRDYLQAVERGELDADQQVIEEIGAIASMLPRAGAVDVRALDSVSAQSFQDVATTAYLASVVKTARTLSGFIDKFGIVHSKPRHSKQDHGDVRKEHFRMMRDVHGELEDPIKRLNTGDRYHSMHVDEE